MKPKNVQQDKYQKEKKSMQFKITMLCIKTKLKVRSLNMPIK